MRKLCCRWLRRSIQSWDRLVERWQKSLSSTWAEVCTAWQSAGRGRTPQRRTVVLSAEGLEVRILPSITASLSSSSYTVSEGGGSLLVQVNLSAMPMQAESVDYATADVTGVSGQDYTQRTGTLNFAPFQQSASFSVPILEDTLDEYDEGFTLTLSNPSSGLTLGTSSASATITENDAAPTLQFSSTHYYAAEGDVKTVTVTLSTASGKTVSVDYATQQLSPVSATAGAD